MSNNIDNLLTDIYSSSNQSQGVKELANLINNLSQLLLKAISQLESRMLKLEQTVYQQQQPRTIQPMSSIPTPAPVQAPRMPSPFGEAVVQRSPPPPPKPTQPTIQGPTRVSAPSPMPTLPQPTQRRTGEGPVSSAEAASMLGATLKPAPRAATSQASTSSGPSFLTGVVTPPTPRTPTVPTEVGNLQPDAIAPANIEGGGAMPTSGGGFRGELAEKLLRRKQKVSQQIEDDFDAPDLSKSEEDDETSEGAVETPKKESTSSELKSDLEDELRNAFSKLKG